MNILFIHEVSYQKKPIFEMHEFPELLAARGHKVSFIQFDEGYKFWRDRKQPTHQVLQGRVHPNSKVNLHTPFQVGIPGVDRILAIFTFMPLLSKLLKKNNFDVIVQYAVPTFGVQTNWLANARGVPVVFRALDVSHKIRKSLLAPLIKLAEKRVYSGATVISANNPGMGDYCQTLGARADKSITNLPPLDLRHFKALKPDSALQQSLGIDPQDKVITYMGSFFYFSGLVELISSFAKANAPKAKLLIIGGGEQEGELHELVKKLQVQDKVKFTGFVSYADLPKYFSLAHVAVNPMQPSLVSNTAFPHKVLQYIAGGLPVVSTKLEGLYQTFGSKSGITWVKSSAEVADEAISLSKNIKVAKSNSETQSGMASKLLGTEIALDSFEGTLIKAKRDS